jgi:Raf kinase inhibitor-like YbhB/YbcL family protein
MRLTSTAFQDGASIPSAFTCDGANRNPELRIEDVPSDAKSLVLLVDDPDVPTNLKPDGVFDHWTLYDIDPDTRVIKEASTTGTEGANGTGKTGYVGPCPPDREHRYFWRIYALDTKLGFGPGKTKKEIQDAMRDHVIAEAVLLGRYDRKR